MLRTDKPRFDALRNGKSAVQFITDVIVEKSCKHPNEHRIFLSATFNPDGITAANAKTNGTMSGYFCKACRKFVLPEPVE
jgi:hypothetical protein